MGRHRGRPLLSPGLQKWEQQGPGQIVSAGAALFGEPGAERRLSAH